MEPIDVQKTRKVRSEARFFVWYEPGLTRFYMGLGWPDTNKRAELEQETKHGGLARYGSFTCKPTFLHLGLVWKLRFPKGFLFFQGKIN